MTLRALLAALLYATAVAFPNALSAQDPERATAERQLEEAQRLLTDAQRTQATKADAAAAMANQVEALKAAVRSAALDLRSHEATIAARTAGLEDLQNTHATYLAEWNAKRRQVGGSLSALVRLLTVPPSATMLGDSDTHQRLRGAFVLRSLIPRLQTRADMLRADLARIQAAEVDVAKGQAALVEAKRALERRLAEAEKLVAHKNSVLESQRAEAERAGVIARRQAKSADDVRELIARLDDGRKARAATIAAERRRRAAIARKVGIETPTEAGPPIHLAGLANRLGGLLLPVTGQVDRRFGEGNDRFAEGITIATSGNMPVLAPADGRIRYAGEFQNYGLVLITDHGGGFHSVITGLARVNAVTDQWVLAGEPLGRVAAHGSLYVEIRKDGRPVDPLKWFTVGRS